MKLKAKKFVIATSVVAVILLLLQLLSIAGLINSALPSPQEVIVALYGLFFEEKVLIDISESLIRVLSGYSLATLAGISIGILSAWLPIIRSMISPIIELLRPIPPIAWIPFAIIVFGLNNFAAIFIVFLGSFFPIFTNTYAKASELPTVLIDTCKSYGITGWRYVSKVLFPQSVPGILSGMRTGIGMAWMSVIAAELVGAQSGLGYLIQYNRLLLRIDYVIASMALIGLVGYMLSIMITAIERTYLSWLKR